MTLTHRRILNLPTFRREEPKNAAPICPKLGGQRCPIGASVFVGAELTREIALRHYFRYSGDMRRLRNNIFLIAIIFDGSSGAQAGAPSDCEAAVTQLGFPFDSSIFKALAKRRGRGFSYAYAEIDFADIRLARDLPPSLAQYFDAWKQEDIAARGEALAPLAFSFAWTEQPIRYLSSIDLEAWGLPPLDFARTKRYVCIENKDRQSDESFVDFWARMAPIIRSVRWFPEAHLREAAFQKTTRATDRAARNADRVAQFPFALYWTLPDGSQTWRISFQIRGASANGFLRRYGQRLDDEFTKKRYVHSGTDFAAFGEEAFPVSYDLGRLANGQDAVALAQKVREFVTIRLNLICDKVGPPEIVPPKH